MEGLTYLYPEGAIRTLFWTLVFLGWSEVCTPIALLLAVLPSLIAQIADPSKILIEKAVICNSGALPPVSLQLGRPPTRTNCRHGDFQSDRMLCLGHLLLPCCISRMV